MENTAQTIVSDTLHLKNRLSIIFLFVTMVLGTGVTYFNWTNETRYSNHFDWQPNYLITRHNSRLSQKAI